MADGNSVYVFQTYGPEYRVRHLDSIDEIYDSWNYTTNTWIPNSQAIVDLFGESKIFDDIEEAWDYAKTCVDTMGDVELEICLLADWDRYKFEELILPDNWKTDESSAEDKK